MLRIVQAKQNEVNKMLFFYHQLVEKINQDLNNKSRFPSDVHIQKAIEQGDLYIGEVSNRIVSMMILTHLDDRDYLSLPLELPKNQMSVMYCMAVDPKYTGYGIANQMISFAIDYSRMHGAEYLRLDVLKEHVKSPSVYENLGFEYAGEGLVLKEESEHPFVSYLCTLQKIK